MVNRTRDLKKSIETPDSKVSFFSVPHNEVGFIHKLEINNVQPNDIRVQVFDEYTDEGGGSHSNLT